MSATTKQADLASVRQDGLVRRLTEAAAHHKHLRDVWQKSAADCRDSIAWFDADPSRIAGYESDHPGKPWADVKAYNEASIRHRESTAHQHATMAEAITEALEYLSPNAAPSATPNPEGHHGS